MPSRTPRILIDVSVAGKNFMRENFPLLMKHLLSGKVHTVRGGEKFDGEVSRCSNLARLFNILEDAGYLIRVDDTEANNATEELSTEIEKQSKRCKHACDDPHLFALGKLRNVTTVATSDKRIGSCRTLLNRTQISRQKYSQLTVVETDTDYKKLFDEKRL